MIQRGDVLHCDFGITAMGLNTDTQHMAYVLREGETDAPAGLQRALARANRLQDILLEQTDVGMSGNDVLHAVLEQMRAEGLDGTMYSHPIGDHGHGAGPLIGLWDYQEGVPGRGDVPVLANMWYSTELQVHHAGGRVERPGGSHGARRGSGDHARRRDAVGAQAADRAALGEMKGARTQSMGRHEDSSLPLCVDLDGTLVRTDTLIEYLLKAVRDWRVLLAIPLWLVRGKAFLKDKLAERIELDVALLPYNTEFIHYLEQQRARGRPMSLVTASNVRIGEAVNAHLELFDEVIASTKEHNVRGREKALVLIERFGERNFVYAGKRSYRHSGVESGRGRDRRLDAGGRYSVARWALVGRATLSRLHRLAAGSGQGFAAVSMGQEHADLRTDNHRQCGRRWGGLVRCDAGVHGVLAHGLWGLRP